MNLSVENVQEVVRDSLFRYDEAPRTEDGRPRDPEDAVIVEGVIGRFGFHPGRLESHRQDVTDMLRELPDTFKKRGGGGMSFLNMCLTKTGHQWGEHHDMDDLLCLAIGLKLGEIQVPREMWSALPGGFPYVVFDVE
jgi:hypothetical protein